MVLVNFVTPQKFLGRQILLIDALPPGYISSFLGLAADNVAYREDSFQHFDHRRWSAAQGPMTKAFKS